jgi:hypothetical protein
MIELYGGGHADHWTGTRMESLGLDADGVGSGAVAVTPGTTSEGTLTSIGTTTYEWGHVVPAICNNVDTTETGQIYSLDIGNSSAAFDGLEEYVSFGATTETISTYSSVGRYSHIPVGTALYARLQTNGATAEAHDVALIGVA